MVLNLHWWQMVMENKVFLSGLQEFNLYETNNGGDGWVKESIMEKNDKRKS